MDKLIEERVLLLKTTQALKDIVGAASNGEPYSLNELDSICVHLVGEVEHHFGYSVEELLFAHEKGAM